MNTSSIPAPRQIGNWVRLSPVRVEKPGGTGYRVDCWRVTYENAVGGEVSERFRTKRDASLFCYEICAAARRDGRNIRCS